MSIYSELKLQLYKTRYWVSGFWRDRLTVVREPVKESRSWATSDWATELHDLTLHELLTTIVQGLEELGVEFKINPAQEAVSASVSVSLKKKKESTCSAER